MTPKITEAMGKEEGSNTGSLSAAPAIAGENHNVDRGTLMWGMEAATLTSSSELYVNTTVTSDYDSADSAASDEQSPRPPSEEGGYSVCSSSADLYPPPPSCDGQQPASVGVFQDVMPPVNPHFFVPPPAMLFAVPFGYLPPPPYGVMVPPQAQAGVPQEIPTPQPSPSPAPAPHTAGTMLAPMPTGTTDNEMSMSVGTRMGPTVLFATAPAADENSMTCDYPDFVSQRMEIVWHGEFDRNFRNFKNVYGHEWVLRPTDSPPEEISNYHLFKDSAKVRFMCPCGNAWTSMKGRCLFWICLDQEDKLGAVMFKLYGQACQKCASDDDDYDTKFCPAMWYPEEVIKVVGNLYNRVGQIYYAFESPMLRIDRRTGKPRFHHNAKKCQACHDGVCRFEWTFS